MEVYGLTGGIGSGKSTVAEMLEEYGIPVVSADELSRMVVAPGSRGLADVVEAFGTEVLDDKGELDRKKMGRIVFTTPERRRQLEAILHPRIRERYEQVLDALEKAGHQVMVYEVPLLFEKKLDQQDEMQGVILVTATTDTRIARVKARDTLTTDDVLARMRAQMPEQEKRQRADYIIHNDGELDDLRREVEHLISRFLRVPPRSSDSVPEVEIEAALELDPDAALELDPDTAVEIDESEIDGELDESEIDGELDESEIDGEIEASEIEESEIDTLSPDEILDEAPTAELDLRVPGVTPTRGVDRERRQVSGELEITMHTPGSGELEVVLSAPTSTASASPAGPASAPMTASTPPSAPVPAPAPSVASPPAPTAPTAPAARPVVAPPPVAGPPSTAVAPPVAGPRPPAAVAPSPGLPRPPAGMTAPLRDGAVSGPSRVHRARLATAPQMVVPFVREKPLPPSKGTPPDDGEPSA